MIDSLIQNHFFIVMKQIQKQLIVTDPVCGTPSRSGLSFMIQGVGSLVKTVTLLWVH